MRSRHRIARLERAAPPRPLREAWAVPATGEEARRQILVLLETLRERKEAHDAALASGDPERRAWAERMISENAARHVTPEAQYRLSELRALLFSFLAKIGHQMVAP